MRTSADILAINAGSSSLRFALFGGVETGLTRLLGGRVERLGSAAPPTIVRGMDGLESRATLAGPVSPERLVEWVLDRIEGRAIAAVGHRVVHGGSRFRATCRVTGDVLAALRAIEGLDPAHVPMELDLVERCAARWPNVPQVACFDTAFHRSLPDVAALLPLPRRFFEQGIRRYGFHGLSFQYVVDELRRREGTAALPARIVLAHLGSGSSLAAIKDGTCVDTTMAMTPTSGIVTGTRTGDIDAGLVSVLIRREGLDADGFERLVTRQSGLLGISETSADVRDLLERRSTDRRAADAIDVFTYQVKKAIGGFVAALGGLDTLAFSGGIGENAPQIRGEICDGLDVFGIRLDADNNDRNAPLISADESRVTVHVVKTDEEATIAAKALEHLKENRDDFG